MKQYKFEYIREWVEKWNPDIPKTVEQMQSALPFDILLPWMGLNDDCELTIAPAKDHYGEDIYNLDEWHKQRDEYIENLAREYEERKNKIKL
jgi:hypothetical protein